MGKEWVLDSDIIGKAQSSRILAGPFIEDLLDHETVAVTALDNADIVDAMSRGSLTAVQVATAFCKRTVYAHQLVRESVSPGSAGLTSLDPNPPRF
jgi:amidase